MKVRETWFYFLLAIPAAGIAIGLQQFVRQSHPEPISPEAAITLKPSFFHPDSAVGTEYDKLRHLVSRRTPTQEKYAKNEFTPIPVGKLKTPKTIERDPEDPDDNDYSGGFNSGEVEDSEAYEFGTSGKRKKKRAAMDEDVGETSDGDVCRAIEYRGDGPAFTKFTESEWGRVLAQFRQVKAGLVEWLMQHRREFPDKMVETMEKQIERTKIQRPPSMEEPDLTWRGVGVWTMGSKGDPIIRLGGGFVKLAAKNPGRSKFELARLVAQSWSPCELQRLEAGETWQPLLKCLNIHEENVCGAGTYSEGGWAVSSVLATTVSPAGCTLPAFKNAALSHCLKKIPLPLNLNSASLPQSLAWLTRGAE